MGRWCPGHMPHSPPRSPRLLTGAGLCAFPGGSARARGTCDFLAGSPPPAPCAACGPLTSIFRPQPPCGDGVPRTTGEPARLEKRVNTPRKGAVALSE